MTALSPSALTAATSVTADEAAAIAAAIERFTHDTAPAPAGAGKALDPWTRAAMLEGVMRDRSAIWGTAVAGGGHGDVPHPWINP